MILGSMDWFVACIQQIGSDGCTVFSHAPHEVAWDDPDPSSCSMGCSSRKLVPTATFNPRNTDGPRGTSARRLAA